MRFRGPAIATFLQRAEENLALLGAQLEGPGLSARSASAGTRQRGLGSNSRSPNRFRPSAASARDVGEADAEHPEDVECNEADVAWSQERVGRKAVGSTSEADASRKNAGQRLVEGWLRQCAGGRGDLEEALGVFAESEREVREQMDIQAKTLLSIDRKVKAFDSRLRAAAEEAATAAASSARLEQRLGGSSSTVARACSGDLPSIVAVAASAAQACTCGNIFAPDAVFCRKCGAKRLVEGLLPTELTELRLDLSTRIDALDSAMAEGRRGEWSAQAAKEHAQQSAREMMAELSRGVRQQFEDFHSQMEARYEQRLSSLDFEIQRHAEEVSRKLLDEFLEGPALNVRVDALVAALQTRRSVDLGSGLLQAAVEPTMHTGLAGQWVAKADFLELEAQLGSLRGEVHRLDSDLSSQMQVFASLEASVSEMLRDPPKASAAALPPHTPPCPQLAGGQQEPSVHAKPVVPDRVPPVASLKEPSVHHKPPVQDKPPPLATDVTDAGRISWPKVRGLASVRERVAALEANPGTPRTGGVSTPRASGASSSGSGSAAAGPPSPTAARMAARASDAMPARGSLDTEAQETQKSRTEQLEERELAVGATVRVKGLQSMPEMNGCIGTCESWSASAGRWIVRLESGEMARVKETNMELASVPVAHGMAPVATDIAQAAEPSSGIPSPGKFTNSCAVGASAASPTSSMSAQHFSHAAVSATDSKTEVLPAEESESCEAVPTALQCDHPQPSRSSSGALVQAVPTALQCEHSQPPSRSSSGALVQDPAACPVSPWKPRVSPTSSLVSLRCSSASSALPLETAPAVPALGLSAAHGQHSSLVVEEFPQSSRGSAGDLTSLCSADAFGEDTNELETADLWQSVAVSLCGAKPVTDTAPRSQAEHSSSMRGAVADVVMPCRLQQAGAPQEMEDVDDVEVLVIDEATVQLPDAGGMAMPEADPLVVEDVMEDGEAETSDEDSGSATSESSSASLPLSNGQGAPIGGPQGSISAPTAARSTGTQESRQPGSSEPPSMELWDSLLTDIADHGRSVPTTSLGNAPRSQGGPRAEAGDEDEDDGEDTESSAQSTDSYL